MSNALSKLSMCNGNHGSELELDLDLELEVSHSHMHNLSLSLSLCIYLISLHLFMYTLSRSRSPPAHCGIRSSRVHFVVEFSCANLSSNTATQEEAATVEASPTQSTGVAGSASECTPASEVAVVVRSGATSAGRAQYRVPTPGWTLPEHRGGGRTTSGRKASCAVGVRSTGTSSFGTSAAAPMWSSLCAAARSLRTAHSAASVGSLSSSSLSAPVLLRLW
jgi:hypothetical protein